MAMRILGTQFARGEGRNPGPLALLLLLVIVAPTACVLWFLREAVELQQLAMRQQLTDIYHDELRQVAVQFSQVWEEGRQAYSADSSSFTTSADRQSPAELFATLIHQGMVDSAIVLDKSGRVVYPNEPQVAVSGDSAVPPLWRSAQTLEFQQQDLVAAAEMYGRIAAREAHHDWQGRALQAQIRCLLRAQKPLEIDPIINDVLVRNGCDSARDTNGRLIAADLELLCLSLPQSTVISQSEMATRLLDRLVNYSSDLIASPQRRFLLAELDSLRPNLVPPTVLKAELLAASYLELEKPSLLAGVLQTTRNPGVFQHYVPQLKSVFLVRGERLAETVHSVKRAGTFPVGAQLVLLPPQSQRDSATPDLSVPLGDQFPNWGLGLIFTAEQPFDSAAKQRTGILIWTATLSIIAIASLGLLVAMSVQRQQRTARLKNDLVATVSHELKTPLASMRLLVDTLLANEAADPQQTRDYLRLVAGENERLTRLIDNFLAFSRLDRTQHRFQPKRITVGAVMSALERSAADRYAGRDFSWQTAVHNPEVFLEADVDALVTALLNLLENAYKYSGDDRQIIVRSFATDQHVCFSVEDNGIGIAPRALMRIFDRFYQVDQSLSRGRGGCGLGLAIVKSIVDGHGGTIDAHSEVGRGSRFTIKIPRSSLT